MRRTILPFLIALVPILTLSAREPHERPLGGPEFAIRDAGLQRQFVVAADELGRIGADGRGSVKKIARRATVESLRSVARPGADLVLYEKGRAHTPLTRRWLTGRILVKLAPGADIAALAPHLGKASWERPDYAPDYVIVTAPAGAGNSLALADWLRLQPGVESAEPMLARLMKKRFTPNDPLFSDKPANAGYEWHLHNVGSRGGVAGVDLNVLTAWDNYRGAGIRIGVVDDGLDLANLDIAAAADTANGHDFNDNDNDPSPFTTDDHGTAVAGLAAARGNNRIGIAGAAPEATLVGLRLLGGPQSDATEAAAFSWRNDIIQVKTSSWGPSDDGATIAGPGPLANAALQNAIATGRGGKGTLFFWAAGNGGVGDNSNFDGYANSIFTAAIGAITDAGTHATYSESGANLIGVVPSDGGAQKLTTTDLKGLAGTNNGYVPGNYVDPDYTNSFGGTSAAAPLAAGVGALMLQANPNLGWRDVQEILIRSAVKSDATEADWANNGAGFHFNHKYGAGLIDATAATNLAATWTNLGPLTSLRKIDVFPAAIPDFPAAGVSKTFTFSAAESLRVEHVTVTVDITHPARGTLEIDLISPSGMVSHLATTRPADPDANLAWTFSTVRHWGESSVGTWIVTVRDKSITSNGTLNTVSLMLYGSSFTSTTAPVVNSATATSGNAGSPFTYQIAATNGPASFNATGLPAGLSINTATGLVSGIATATGTTNVTISATNASGTGSASLAITMGVNLVAALADALDQPSLAWNLDLTSAWSRVTGAAPTTHDGIDAARSATIADGGSTSISVIVVGPQVLRYWWKVSSEQGFDFLHFDLDGFEQAAISGNVDWQQRGFIIPTGAHELKWTYDKDVSNSAGSDAGWVDQVTFTPYASSAPVFTLEPQPLAVGVGALAGFACQTGGPDPITYQWRFNGVTISGAIGRTYVIPVTTAANSGTYTCLATNANGTTTSLSTPLTVAAVDVNIANAVDTTGLAWTKNGSLPQWSRTAVLQNTHDNVDSAQATGLLAGGSTTIATTVIGPGNLTFWWRTDGTVDEDVLGYNLDGIEQASITSTGSWLQSAQSVPVGIHTLSWTYYAGSNGSGFSGRGLLDQVTYVPTPFGVWQAAKFTIAQRLDALVSAANTDPDGDGITNLAEHYFGTGPLANGVAALPAFAFDGTDWSLTYQHDTTATSTTRFIEHSPDLRTWIAIVPTETILSTAGTVQTIKAVLPPVIAGSHFYRLRLQLNE